MQSMAYEESDAMYSMAYEESDAMYSMAYESSVPQRQLHIDYDAGAVF